MNMLLAIVGVALIPSAVIFLWMVAVALLRRYRKWQRSR